VRRRRPPAWVVLAAIACGDLQTVGSSSASADSAAGEVKFRMTGPGGAALVVPVYINGDGPVDLILDTGATLTCLDSSLARELALPERRAALGMAVAVGGSGRVRLHAVDSLRVGRAVARSLTVCAIDLRELRRLGGNVRGLLGLNVLREFRVTLDFEREIVRLAPPGG
jgi:predicted aspartyl protease